MPVPLELYTTSTFIGLFVEEHVAELLKGFAADFASEAAAKAGLIYHSLHICKHLYHSRHPDTADPMCTFFSSSIQMLMWSLIKSNFMSLWHTTSMLVTFQFWRSWPKMWTCAQAATGWPCSIQETSALLTTRSLFSYLLQILFGPQRLSLTLIATIPPVDAAGHVPICTSEWWRAGADAWRFYLHVARGAEHRQRGVGVRHLAGHGAVRPAAWELHQPSRWVRHLGRPRVRHRSSECSQQAHSLSRAFESKHTLDDHYVVRKWKSPFWICFSVSVWLSGPTQFSIVRLHLTPAALLAGYYSMESWATVYSTA